MNKNDKIFVTLMTILGVVLGAPGATQLIRQKMNEREIRKYERAIAADIANSQK